MQATPSAATTTRARPRCTCRTRRSAHHAGRKMETAIADVKRAAMRKNSRSAGLPSARVRSLSPARCARSRPRPRSRALRRRGRVRATRRQRRPAAARRPRRCAPPSRTLTATARASSTTASCGARSRTWGSTSRPRRPLSSSAHTTTIPTASSTSASSRGSSPTSTASSAAGPAALMGTMSGPRPSASVRAAFDRFDRNRSLPRLPRAAQRAHAWASTCRRAGGRTRARVRRLSGRQARHLRV